MQTIAAPTASLPPRRLAALRELLRRAGIDWDDGAEYTVILESDEGETLATGSRQDNVLKCIAVSPEAQGEGYAATVVTELVKNAVLGGHSHLFIFTSPKSAAMFTQLGFSAVAGTRDAVLLENRPNGIKNFVASIKRENPGEITDGLTSAIVANCNPFTYGHRYLVETAAKASALVHLFVLSADKSRFSAADRMAMVKAGTADIPNVIVHPTGDYLISAATFPSYFIKDKARAENINCELDLTVFAQCFANPMGITSRYVGTEPLDEVTRAYNTQMHAVLPAFGVEVVEVQRLEKDGAAVSASRLRALLDAGRLDEIKQLAPPATYEFLAKEAHGA
jgi:[citrate (pro-3S)-lyase] ligase